MAGLPAKPFVFLFFGSKPGSCLKTCERVAKRSRGTMMISRLVESNSQPRIDAVPMCRVSKCLPKLEADHIHGFTFNATFDSQENRWKADSPFYEAAFNARLASKLIES